jgi:hypothetical protein
MPRINLNDTLAAELNHIAKLDALESIVEALDYLDLDDLSTPPAPRGLALPTTML